MSNNLDENNSIRWVQCDNCQKWRKLPFCSESDYEKLKATSTSWNCEMNLWDPARASCNIPEESSDNCLNQYHNNFNFCLDVYCSSLISNSPLNLDSEKLKSVLCRFSLRGFPWHKLPDCYIKRIQSQILSKGTEFNSLPENEKNELLSCWHDCKLLLIRYSIELLPAFVESILSFAAICGNTTLAEQVGDVWKLKNNLSNAVLIKLLKIAKLVCQSKTKAMLPKQVNYPKVNNSSALVQKTASKKKVFPNAEFTVIFNKVSNYNYWENSKFIKLYANAQSDQINLRQVLPGIYAVDMNKSLTFHNMMKPYGSTKINQVLATNKVAYDRRSLYDSKFGKCNGKSNIRTSSATSNPSDNNWYISVVSGFSWLSHEAGIKEYIMKKYMCKKRTQIDSEWNTYSNLSIHFNKDDANVKKCTIKSQSSETDIFKGSSIDLIHISTEINPPSRTAHNKNLKNKLESLVSSRKKQKRSRHTNYSKFYDTTLKSMVERDCIFSIINANRQSKLLARVLAQNLEIFKRLVFSNLNHDP